MEKSGTIEKIEPFLFIGLGASADRFQANCCSYYNNNEKGREGEERCEKRKYEK